MSHTVKLALAMRDKANLKRACEALKIPFQEGPHTVQLFSGPRSRLVRSAQRRVAPCAAPPGMES